MEKTSLIIALVAFPIIAICFAVKYASKKTEKYRDHVANGDCWTCEKRHVCPYSNYDE